MPLPRRRQADPHHAGGGGAHGGGGHRRIITLRSSFSGLAIVLSLVAIANVMIYYGSGKGLMNAGTIKAEDITMLNLARSMSELANGLGGDETQVCVLCTEYHEMAIHIWPRSDYLSSRYEKCV